MHPDDLHRFAELGVTYDTTGQWMGWDPILSTVTATRLGKGRANAAYPMKTVADAGGNVSLGSDFPAASYFADYQALNAIEMATTRQVLGKPDAPRLGGEEARVPLDLAIGANTLGAAWGMGVDDWIGSIEVGKKADLIVLDQNLFEIDPHPISQTTVELTMMNGIIRHRNGI
ncbi:MAG TPA: amidohydrolase family protein [Vicinamibacteria bacterium]